VNATASQRACWVLDRAISMADHAAQLGQAHDLSLQGDSLPEKIGQRLRVSSRMLRVLRSWIQAVRLHLGPLFNASSSDVDELEALLSLSAVPLHSQDLLALASPEAWSGHCSADVLVQPFMHALASLQSDLYEVDADIARHIPALLALRSERAAVAGELEACEKLLESDQVGRKETLAGVFNASRLIDNTLWLDTALRKQVAVTLARAVQDSQRRVEISVLQGAEALPNSSASVLRDRRDNAESQLRLADRAILEGCRKLKELVERRRDLADKMKNHLKYTLAQCLPPAADAPRSRYARFEVSSPAANAVQLSLEVSDFLARAVADTLPQLIEVMREAVSVLRAGAGQSFRLAPSMSRWWEWLPDAAEHAGPVLGFEGFTTRYQNAMEAYNNQLVEGGHVAALHSMWSRWEEIESQRPFVAEDFAEEATIPGGSKGWWTRLNS